jgi:phytoene/squalene synthetase
VSEARTLLRELEQRDLAALERAGTPSPALDEIRHRRPGEAYLAHLRRVVRAIPGEAPRPGYAWSLALEWLAADIAATQDVLDRRSVRASLTSA